MRHTSPPLLNTTCIKSLGLSEMAYSLLEALTGWKYMSRCFHVLPELKYIQLSTQCARSYRMNRVTGADTLNGSDGLGSSERSIEVM